MKVPAAFKSKKFQAALVAAACWLAGVAGFDLTPEAATAFVSPFMVVIAGQAYVDRKKQLCPKCGAPVDTPPEPPAPSSS